MLGESPKSPLNGNALLNCILQCVEWYKLNKHPEKTQVNLKNFLLRFYRWLGDRELSTKVCKEFVKYMQQRGFAESTIRSDVGRLKCFLGWLYHEAELTPTDWSRDVKRPKEQETLSKEPEKLLSPSKLEELIIQITTPKTVRKGKLGERDLYVNKEYREFFLFFMKMGLRPSEARKIDPAKVNLDGSPPSVMVFRSKLKKWQSLGLPLDFIEPIRERVKRGKWFDVGEAGLQIKMRELSKLAGTKVNLYSIRKSVDTYLLDNGAPLMQAAIHQGHNVGIMQKTYVKFSAKQSSEVINTYSPYINKTKIPVSYTLPDIEKKHNEWATHPNITKEYEEIILKDGTKELIWTTRVKMSASEKYS